MKIKCLVAFSVAVLAMAFSVNSMAGGIVGGVIDTEKEQIGLVKDVGNRMFVYMGSVAQDIKEKRLGRLVVVSARGVASVSRSAMVDKAGIRIAPPSGPLDKVVFLDSYGFVKGAMGLSAIETTNVLKSRPRVFSDSYLMYEQVTAEAARKFDALRNAAQMFTVDAEEDEQVFYFNLTVEMLAGKPFAGLVKDVVAAADDSTDAAAIGRSDGDLTSLARGINLVAEGDNGGFGITNPIAEGDNGGFGITNPIAEGDNGGFGITNPIAEGDNGGFGTVADCGDDIVCADAVVQGFKVDPELPAIPSVAKNVGGVLFILFD